MDGDHTLGPAFLSGSGWPLHPLSASLEPKSESLHTPAELLPTAPLEVRSSFRVWTRLSLVRPFFAEMNEWLDEKEECIS